MNKDLTAGTDYSSDILMPSYKTHLSFGAMASLVIILLLKEAGFSLESGTAYLGFLLALFSSLLPDIDCGSSKMFRALEAVVMTSGIILIFAFLKADFYHLLVSVALWAVLAKALLLALKPRHRGVTHHLASCLILSATVLFLSLALKRNPALALFAFAGYFSHILMDEVL